MPNNNPLGGTWWSDDHCADLTTLLATGMIYREIARTINEKFGTNFSKNSVVGKVQRLGLTPPAKPKAPPYVRKPKARRSEREVLRFVASNGNSNGMRVLRTVVLEQAKLRCAEIVPQHASVSDLTGCRYPYGDGPFTFCNHPQAAGSSYCAPHVALCRETPRVPIYRFVGRAA
jgi:hypothetical protein